MPLLAAFGLIGLGLGGCAAENKARDPKQAQQAKTLVTNATGLLNPTNTSPTEIEGTWLAPCTACTSGTCDRGAQAYVKGYIFMGNSFYKQIDYYSSADCTWTGDTLSQGRLYADIAAGWFSIGAGSGGLKNINMLAAPNFGSRYELNVYSVSGSGSDKTLAMGNPDPYSTVRPTGTSVNFVHWDTQDYTHN